MIVYSTTFFALVYLVRKLATLKTYKLVNILISLLFPVLILMPDIIVVSHSFEMAIVFSILVFSIGLYNLYLLVDENKSGFVDALNVLLVYQLVFLDLLVVKLVALSILTFKLKITKKDNTLSLKSEFFIIMILIFCSLNAPITGVEYPCLFLLSLYFVFNMFKKTDFFDQFLNLLLVNLCFTSVLVEVGIYTKILFFSIFNIFIFMRLFSLILLEDDKKRIGSILLKNKIFDWLFSNIKIRKSLSVEVNKTSELKKNELVQKKQNFNIHSTDEYLGAVIFIVMLIVAMVSV